MKNWRRVTSASFLTALMAIGNVVPSMAATTDNSISQREKDNAALAREVATEGMVYLEMMNKPYQLKVKMLHFSVIVRFVLSVVVQDLGTHLMEDLVVAEMLWLI